MTTSTEFPWGTIKKIHKIGAYSIIEYIVGPEWTDKGSTMFQGPQASWLTLDLAILDCICSKYQPDFDDILVQATARLLGIPDTDIPEAKLSYHD